ncbi:hypothetical protein CHLNCDRAFT_138249 [Chlorella variabilis]|uniref:EF-hand domain-containing protein n=1 Tax=Chlorella variabilis TaxID=554065 RepID=E1Z3X1_CHLVA|nr:hypothetical protein CHLNCDRAFT_138249 [Chlorella variabilis]EFN59555.1 hypothetical protein CHLNCDRAFT_138249 [Chlorella variabilis]|eukprot:XP_005851657.1 hypothetical protein CHLNCDRAFT_138249 [Chlorella variabilis]
MEAARLQHIFAAGDRNRDGGLDETEVAWLIQMVNPEVPLGEAALGLIVEEVWAAFPAHVKQQGLTFDGLQQLYAEGLGDPEHDYQLLVQQAADETAAATAAAAVQLEGSATKGQRMETEGASCTPAKAGAVTPRDVFDDLRAPGTMAGLVADSAIDVGADPAGSEDGTIKSHRALDAGAAGACPEGLHGSPPMTARSDVFDFLATPRTEAALFGPPQALHGINTKARQAAEAGAAVGGSSMPITPMTATSDVFDMVATGSTAADEEDREALSLGGTPSAAAAGGGVARRPGFRLDVNGLAEGAVSLGTLVAGAAATASPLNFTLRVPTDSFHREGGWEEQQQLALLHAFERALPEGSAAELTSAAPAADGSLIVTVAASLPRGSSTAAEEAQYMASVLRNDAKQARFCC